jgi:NAD(P)-dependent dehydrogenase (short-subunit alcohol dehydrogenase family)
MVTATEPRVTIITGGGSGIGRAVALRLAARDHHVCVCDLNKQGLDETAERVRSVGGRAETIVLDVRDGAAVEHWCSGVADKFGKIDCLFSNAGVNARAPVADMPLESWSLLLDTHVTGTFNFCQAVLRRMVGYRSGAIVITSSDYAIAGMPGAANYAAAKTALYALAKSLALEFAPYGIRVNAIGPGPIDTPLIRAGRTQMEWEERLCAYENRLPMKRLGQPEEVASVVDFLLSQRASYITGQLLQPNGGQVIW